MILCQKEETRVTSKRGKTFSFYIRKDNINGVYINIGRIENLKVEDWKK